MLSTYLKAKIHRATVGAADLNYEGSITIGKKLLKASGMKPFQKVDIYNITNGERFSTYIITGDDEGREIQLNGAAARKVAVDDLVIICLYVLVDDEKEEPPTPVIVKIKDNKNSF